MKAKVTCENCVSHGYNGAEWYLYPVRVEHDGKVLNEGDPGFREACVGLDVLSSVHVNHVDYCWDNFVDGLPDETLTLGDATLDVAELVAKASEGVPPYNTVKVELTPPPGFSL